MEKNKPGDGDRDCWMCVCWAWGEEERGRLLLFYVGCLGKASLIRWHWGDLRKYGSKRVGFFVKSAPGREKSQCKGPEVEAHANIGLAKKFIWF